ncbi:MAG TPA: quinoprotein dehydrogenase-associated putative ABC transporter substrate-binding protein [Polyangiaceae bacterium]|nr:quinoprotein dehydrogenase-associated putative ABC transporter substrate-binding protein [Polyangiaceae bacterium]
MFSRAPGLRRGLLLGSLTWVGLPWVGLSWVACQSGASCDAPDSQLAISTLRVCADPNNLPFSNAKGAGFENQLAELLGSYLGRKVEYTFWPSRRGFIRQTLKRGLCDVVMGVPVGFELTENTAPYYHSSYVFVTRDDGSPAPVSFDDPRLLSWRIGLHTIGDDYQNVPPAEALAGRGLISNIRGYPITGDYSQPDPPRRLLDALSDGEVDVAVVWGPLAGFFAPLAGAKLRLSAIESRPDARANPELDHALPMTFGIAVGVRRGEHALRAELDHALAAERDRIRQLLDSYGVPR